MESEELFVDEEWKTEESAGRGGDLHQGSSRNPEALRQFRARARDDHVEAEEISGGTDPKEKMLCGLFLSSLKLHTGSMKKITFQVMTVKTEIQNIEALRILESEFQRSDDFITELQNFFLRLD